MDNNSSTQQADEVDSIRITENDNNIHNSFNHFELSLSNNNNYHEFNNFGNVNYDNEIFEYFDSNILSQELPIVSDFNLDPTAVNNTDGLHQDVILCTQCGSQFCSRITLNAHYIIKHGKAKKSVGGQRKSINISVSQENELTEDQKEIEAIFANNLLQPTKRVKVTATRERQIQKTYSNKKNNSSIASISQSSTLKSSETSTRFLKLHCNGISPSIFSMIDNYFIHSVDWDIKYFSVDIKQTEKTFFASIKMLVDTANPTNSPISIDSLIEQCTVYFNHNKEFFKFRDQIINFIPEVKREHLQCYHTIMQKVLGSDIKIFLWSTEGYSPKVIDQQLPLLSITPSNLSRSNSISSSSSTITASTDSEVNNNIKTFTIISFLNNTTGIYSFAPLIKF